MRGLKSAFVAQTVLHERLAFVAFESLVTGVLVAGFHFFLLSGLFAAGCGCRGCRFGTQTLFHEGLALVALFVSSILVAGGHFALLGGFGCRCCGSRGRSRISSVSRTKRQRQAQAQKSQQFFHVKSYVKVEKNPGR